MFYETGAGICKFALLSKLGDSLQVKQETVKTYFFNEYLHTCSHDSCVSFSGGSRIDCRGATEGSGGMDPLLLGYK